MMKLVLIFLVFLGNGKIPELNKKVIEYVDSVMGTTVGRGECWDLAAGALDFAGAYLNRHDESKIYIFGKKLNPAKDKLYPGDIIQFENVLLETKEGNAIVRQTMSRHTAIIYEITGKNRFKIAHQNNSFSGNKVGISDLDLNGLKKGKVIFYRPVSQ